MPRGVRRNSGSPTRASSAAICALTAGYVRCRSRAAPLTLPARYTATNTRNSSSEAISIRYTPTRPT
ncbi:hypothetical protein GCM10008960_27680 [Deinococcus sedimenti]|uniref:Uncharacterized protein n=1 Tax=Deinococcus sedimenti TaxID=1867090 RepID=A0ABQ2S8Z8_9DEIO|nr:hypothetical protein GCM10008960_27680 [Deinococcus sedimenti]